MSHHDPIQISAPVTAPDSGEMNDDDLDAVVGGGPPTGVSLPPLTDITDIVGDDDATAFPSPL